MDELVNFQVRVKKELRDFLRRKALEKDTSMNKIIALLLERYKKKEENKLI